MAALPGFAANDYTAIDLVGATPWVALEYYAGQGDAWRRPVLRSGASHPYERSETSRLDERCGTRFERLALDRVSEGYR